MTIQQLYDLIKDITDKERAVIFKAIWFIDVKAEIDKDGDLVITEDKDG